MLQRAGLEPAKVSSELTTALGQRVYQFHHLCIIIFIVYFYRTYTNTIKLIQNDTINELINILLYLSILVSSS